MLKEFKYQIRQKYLLLLLIALAYCVFAGCMMARDAEGNVNRDFSYDIENYASIEEVRAQYEDLQIPKEANSSQIVMEELPESGKNYYSQLYKYIIDNELPYDSLVEFDDASYSGLRKHTHFHLFGMSAYFIMLFMVFGGGLVGSIVPTIDFNRKTAKLVYSSGVNKKRVLLRKYAVSLVGLLGLELIMEIIVMLLSLIYVKSGVQYCYILWGSKLYFFNFMQFAMIHVLHNMIMCIVFYTIIFFFSFLCKNAIISSISVFTLLFLNASMTIRVKEVWLACLYNMPGGLFTCLVGGDYETKPIYFLLTLVYVAIGGILCACALEATKKFDFSR